MLFSFCYTWSARKMKTFFVCLHRIQNDEKCRSKLCKLNSEKRKNERLKRKSHLATIARANAKGKTEEHFEWVTRDAGVNCESISTINSRVFNAITSISLHLAPTLCTVVKIKIPKSQTKRTTEKTMSFRPANSIISNFSLVPFWSIAELSFLVFAHCSFHFWLFLYRETFDQSLPTAMQTTETVSDLLTGKHRQSKLSFRLRNRRENFEFAFHFDSVKRNFLHVNGANIWMRVSKREKWLLWVLSWLALFLVFPRLLVANFRSKSHSSLELFGSFRHN